MPDEKMLLCHFSWSQDSFLNVQYSKTTQLWQKKIILIDIKIAIIKYNY